MHDDGRTVIAAARRWYQTLADYHHAVATWHAEGGEPNMIAVHQAANRHWTAFDLATECGVTYAEARAALERYQWSVTRARKRLRP